MQRAARTLGWIGLSCLAVAVGCEDDQALWGDAMSPTQMQRADGDSEDPFVENASYPFVQGPWWSNPAYNGG